MAKNKWSDKVSGIKITLDDLEALSTLYGSPYFPLMSRIANKMVTMWKDQSFKLDELDPHFHLKHQRFVERSLGIKMFLRFIEESSKKLEKEDE